MKRVYIIAIAFVIISTGIIALIQFINIMPSTNSVGNTAEEEKEKPNYWFYMQRSYPQDKINYDAWREAVANSEVMRQTAPQSRSSWQEAGPTNIGGRITTIAASASNPNFIFAGAADGGVWRSTNSGVNWQSVFDFNSTLSIGAIAVDPMNADVAYVGTGEANSSGDSYPGNGIFKTLDGGLSWQNMGLQDSYYIGRIAINPQNIQQIFVAATGLLFGKNLERGIYRSNDGGQNWQQVLFVSDSTAGIDVVIDPSSPNKVYAAMWERIRYPYERRAGGVTSGIYKSADGGDNWTLLSGGLPAPSATIGRIGLAIAPTNPNVLYAIYADHPGYFDGIFKTTDSGNSWSQVNDGGLGNLYSNFGWYFGNIYVDPNNENTVYALGLAIYKSTSGGNSWGSITGGIHVDQHAIWVDPTNSNHLVIGNDGGIFISQNGGSSFSKVLNLPITQFYAATVDYNNPQRLYGGTQDNGTMRTLTGQLDDWSIFYGGDGFYVIIEPNNSNVIYAESQYGGLGKSTNGGSNFNNATNGINGSDRTNWMTPVVMDPNDSNILYYGTYRVYKTTNGAGFWSPVSSDLSNGPYSGGLNFGTITTIAVASTNSNVVYAGTDDGNVWISEDGGGTWNFISGQLPTHWVTYITVDPANDSTAVVSFSGYKMNQYVGHIFRTVDRGQNWVDISANLPQAPVNKVVIDPDFPGIYYAASDVGVFFTSDSGNIWSMLAQNLPASVIMDLVFHQPTRTLVSATHGRSMYKIEVGNVVDIDTAPMPVIANFNLISTYPNPFNSQIAIKFRLNKSLPIEVVIFDVLGRKVKLIKKGTLSPAEYLVKWNGIDDTGNSVSSGKYLVLIKAGNQQLTKSITYVK